VIVVLSVGRNLLLLLLLFLLLSRGEEKKKEKRMRCVGLNEVRKWWQKERAVRNKRNAKSKRERGSNGGEKKKQRDVRRESKGAATKAMNNRVRRLAQQRA
jgi:hypothetical protein